MLALIVHAEQNQRRMASLRFGGKHTSFLLWSKLFPKSLCFVRRPSQTIVQIPVELLNCESMNIF